VAAETISKLVVAHNTEAAVQVTLRPGRHLPEVVGVGHVDDREGWVDLYVAGPFGDDVCRRVPLTDIADVEITEQTWL
jgi:hypothetical protein